MDTPVVIAHYDPEGPALEDLLKELVEIILVTSPEE
ncbi:hypothetical protein SPFL3102_03595 [Sporomusaceae bacterium FL31]|nr:hypothetical protein SPFL3101_00410 [Sporomusaceae bacterium FL31]GCE35744.1 hypothetical protein SPFL3102_03595 [Sporomusaceae bacterium]